MSLVFAFIGPFLLVAGDGAFRGPSRVFLDTGAVDTAPGVFFRGGDPGVAVAHGTNSITILGIDPFRRELSKVGASLQAGTAVCWLRAADLDGDGIDDLVVADPGTTAYSFHSVGDGTFGPPVSVPVAQVVRAAAIGDWNVDGCLDLATLSHPIDILEIFLGKGDCTFTHIHEIETKAGEHNHDIETFDGDGDGRADLLIASSLSGILPLLGDGEGGFTKQARIQSDVLGLAPELIAPDDFNGDGLSDFLAISFINQFSARVELGVGGGTFRRTEQVYGPINRASALSDFDHDGRRDMLLAPKGLMSLDLLFGIGDGTFQTPEVMDLPLLDPIVIALVDMDLDGRDDLIFPGWDSPSIAVSWGRDGPDFIEREIPLAGFQDVGSIAAVDLDGSGSPDIFVAGKTKKEVLLYTDPGHEAFRLAGPTRTLTVGSSFSSLESIDLDGDAVPDLAGMNFASGAALVALLAPTGAIRSESTFPVGLLPGPIAVGSLDGDSLPDLAVPCASQRKISLFQNLGSGSFAAERPIPTIDIPRELVLADFDRDGSLDIAVLSPGAVAIHWGSATGNLDVPDTVIEDPGKGLNGLASGDIDGDGLPDLVATNKKTSQIDILRGTGGRSFEPLQSLVPSAPPSSVVIADLDGNELLDILAGSEEVPTIAVFLARGTSRFDRASEYLLRFLPGGIRVLDLDLDGSLDLLSWSAQKAGILFGRPAGPASRIRRGDANNDGKMDLSDAIDVLGVLFLGSGSFPCLKAADSNDDGLVDLSDAISILGRLFLGDGPLPPPGSDACGPDPTSDGLACKRECSS
jgi:hypothetical protein